MFLYCGTSTFFQIMQQLSLYLQNTVTQVVFEVQHGYGTKLSIIYQLNMTISCSLVIVHRLTSAPYL